MIEKWKPVVGFETRYEMNREQELVRDRHTGRILTPKLIAGKPYVQLRIETNRRTDRAVSRLIAETFDGAGSYRPVQAVASDPIEPITDQNPLPNETWRPVVGWEEEYDVSDHGRVRKRKASHKSPAGHILTPGNCGGYANVVLYRDGQRTTRNVHTLVAHTFLGPPPSPKHEVNHKDRNRSHNLLTNLEWLTRKQNVQHAHTTGPPIQYAQGTKNSHAVLTEQDVRTIRKLSASGLSCPQIAQRFEGKIHRVTVRDIVAGRTWTHVV